MAGQANLIRHLFYGTQRRRSQTVERVNPSVIEDRSLFSPGAQYFAVQKI
jgi:hypothetical protein